MKLWALFVGATLSFACERGDEGKLLETRPPKPAFAPPKPAAPAPVVAATTNYQFPAAERVVALGDLHGDAEAARQALRLAGAIDARDHWSGGKLVVVQTGDQLDRGDQEREILDLLDRLASEAKDAGGALHVLNGNHEVMNVQGDFRYVTPRGLVAFADVTPRAPMAERFPSEAQARASAFLPGGGEALRLARRPIIVQVGNTVFAHAGVRAPLVDHGIDRLNRDAAAWMRGELAQVPRLLQDQEGPVWTRVFGAAVPDADACATLNQALTKLGAARMVVGHSVQEGGISSACDGRLQRIDVGLSSFYGGTSIQVLELSGDVAKVLRAQRRP